MLDITKKLQLDFLRVWKEEYLNNPVTNVNDLKFLTKSFKIGYI